MPAPHFDYYKGSFRRMYVGGVPPYIETPAVLRGHKTYYNERVFLITAVWLSDHWEKEVEVYPIKLEDLDDLEKITEAEYLGVLLQCRKS